MPFFSRFKSTVLCLSICFLSCGQKQATPPKKEISTAEVTEKEIIVSANRTQEFIPLLQNKKVAVVANQTSVIFKEEGHTHLVDSLLSLNMDIQSVFAPEHGFRGKADAGEAVKDGLDNKTGLPILSLHGKNKKPTPEQLEKVDLVLFDIQDVGVRFYTYIATLQLVMEACAEAKIPIVVLDRPNPNAHYVDGPTMQAAHTSFLGYQKIPLVYGMTIGEYAQMLNEEGWLTDGAKAELTVIPLENYTHNSSYELPIRPSPNLPNDVSINLYPSLGLFEGTTVNAGRGTEFQFQRYGASFLDSTVFDFSYMPKPNFGAKYPKEEDKICFGENLSAHSKMDSVSLQWLLKAYQHSNDKEDFFKTASFTKHAGTTVLQKQIETGLSEEEIKATWKEEIAVFKKVRAKYLLYGDSAD